MDATFVNVPKQRNSREENAEIKQGETSADWSDAKSRQKDIDARWVKINDETHFGYKDHIAADVDTKLITGYSVTSCEVHDSVELFNLIKKEDQIVYADSAYRSEKTENKLLHKNKKSKIHEKGKRGKPLTALQIKRNKKKSTIRVKVEHIFGYMTNSMNGIFIKSVGIMIAKCQIGLKNITYNLFRLVQLDVKIIMY